MSSNVVLANLGSSGLNLVLEQIEKIKKIVILNDLLFNRAVDRQKLAGNSNLSSRRFVFRLVFRIRPTRRTRPPRLSGDDCSRTGETGSNPGWAWIRSHQKLDQSFSFSE